MDFTSPHVDDSTSTELKPDEIQEGQHFINAIVSDANQKLPMGFNSAMTEIILFEKGFPTCNSSNPYDKSISTTARDDDG